MPCYMCGHCNKCGMYSTILDIRCNVCDEPIPAGSASCAKCGTSFTGNMKTGKYRRAGGEEVDLDGGLLKLTQDESPN